MSLKNTFVYLSGNNGLNAWTFHLVTYFVVAEIEMSEAGRGGLQSAQTIQGDETIVAQI